jgi:hypothetical protein
MAKRRTKKHRTSRSGGPSLFKLAARDKGYKAAKRAKNKADARAKRAWKKAQVKARKKLRRRKYC